MEEETDRQLLVLKQYVTDVFESGLTPVSANACSPEPAGGKAFCHLHKLI